MIDFKVTPDNGEPFNLTAGSRDVLNWEKTARGKTFQNLMENMAMGDLYRLAHLAAMRQQLFTGSLQEFEESCELDVVDEGNDEELDPTRPEATPGT